MKNKIIIFLIIGLIASNLIAQTNQFEIGVRYLKLGNSYREAGLYDKAIEYLGEGKKIVEKYKSTYWKAVSYEYFGYLYKDINMPNEAYKNLLDAYSIYNRIITQSDGSQAALKATLEKLVEAMNQEISKVPGTGATSGNTIVDPKDTVPPNTNTTVYNSLNEALNNPNDVYALDLSDKELTTLSPTIGELKNLEILILKDNDLEKLPDEIGDLKNLTVLDLENNSITKLPKSINKLKKLELINLKNNSMGVKSLLELMKALPNAKILLSDDEE